MFHRTKLKNGMRLITIPVKGSDVVTVLVLIKAGSRYEPANLAGISHFSEHMFFKGTKKRPTVMAISSEIDGVGGATNAFTAKEYTGFYIKVAKKYLNLAIDVLADILQNSTFQDREINNEKGVILQEINLDHDTPLIYIQKFFDQLLYSGHPLGRDILGEKKTVVQIQREDFVNYLKNLYTAENTVVVITGALAEAKNIENTIQSNFQFPPTKKVNSFERIIECQKEPNSIFKKQKTKQTHLCLGVRGYSHVDPKKYILEIISSIIGGGMSSRLFNEIRDKRGLAYYIKSSFEAYKDCGYLMIQAGVDHKNLKRTIWVILKELTKLKNHRISPKELTKAKEYLKGTITLNIEDSLVLAELIGLQELLHEETLDIKEIFEKIDQVSPEDVQAVAQELFVNSGLNLAIISGKDDREQIKNILKLSER